MSVDPATKRRLKSLARGRHGGNVSALITELALEGEKLEAFERAWQWYGGPEPTQRESTAIRAAWEEGWKVASRAAKSRSKRVA